MMNKFNITTNNPIVKIIFMVIIVCFLITGISSYFIIRRPNFNNYAAKVNSSIISKTQLQHAFQQEKKILQQLLADQFNEIDNNQAQEMRILRKQVLDRLIGITLLNQYANKLNLNVSDNKIKQEIYKIPIFQTNGHFDSIKYRTALLQYNIIAADLAKEIRQNLVNQQLRKIYITDEFVLPTEINNYANLIFQQREVKTATLYLADYQAQAKKTVTDKELQSYYNENNQKFISPKKVQVSYIKLDAFSQRKNVTVKDEELQIYYEKNINNFIKPTKKHFSMIQLATEQEAHSVAQALANGADFKKLVAEKSIDQFSAKNHGAIGWMEDSSTPSEIITANLTKKGQISSVIKSGENYIIFRLDNIKPEVIKPFNSVKNEITNTIKNEKALLNFYSLQQMASSAAMNNNTSLSAVEKVTGIKIVTTGWFDRYTIPTEIKFAKIANFIFNEQLLSENIHIPTSTRRNSDVININSNLAFIIRVENYKPETIQSFNESKNLVIDLVTRIKANKAMEDDGNKLINALRDGDGADNRILMKLGLGITFNKSIRITLFSQNDYLLTDKIFDMPMPISSSKHTKAIYASTKDVNDNLIIIKLIQVIPGKPSVEEFKFLSKRYPMIISNIMMTSLIRKLHKEAKITLGQLELDFD